MRRRSGDIVIRDYDASNKPVMEALSEILHYGGFLLNFQTITSDDGTPQTNLSIARRDALAAAAPKLIFLAAAGTSFDPTENNTTALHRAGLQPDRQRLGRREPARPGRGDFLPGARLPAEPGRRDHAAELVHVEPDGRDRR